MKDFTWWLVKTANSRCFRCSIVSYSCGGVPRGANYADRLLTRRWGQSCKCIIIKYFALQSTCIYALKSNAEINILIVISVMKEERAISRQAPTQFCYLPGFYRKTLFPSVYSLYLIFLTRSYESDKNKKFSKLNFVTISRKKGNCVDLALAILYRVFLLCNVYTGTST